MNFKPVMAAMAAGLQLTAVQARTFDFSAGKWDRGAFFEARNDDWNRGAPIVQMPDCVMNANDPSWTDEDLFKNHQADVYSSLILTNRFCGDVTFSSRMSFDHRMAPALVVAGEFATDAQGRKAFRDHYEIVLFEDGLNVWRHRRPGGGKSEIEKVAYAAHVFRKGTPYELKVAVRRKKAYGGRLTTDIEVSADGAEVGFRDETVPATCSIGLLGSEGRCRFYDLTVDDAALAASARRPSGLSFGRPFTRGAVLQRGRPVPVWGQAPVGAAVLVSLGGASAKGKADAQGAWRVNLPALPASAAPQTLTVSSGDASLSVEDVLVGEVWLCAGQSNMAMALVHPQLTRYRDGIGSLTAQMTRDPAARYRSAEREGPWQPFEPEFLASGKASSIPVHFACELRARLQVPVGVVVAAAGGCNIDAFLPSLDGSLDRHFLGRFYPYSMRGAVWYQGETNVYLGETEAYGEKLRQLYDRWRTNFENRDFRFYYVQLAPFQRGKVTHKQKDGTSRTFDYDALFPEFLCVQAAFEKTEPNAAMTVVNDLGIVHDIHPNEKWLVARRLALHALKRDYGYAGVEDRSPEPMSATAGTNGLVRIAFDHAKRLYVYQRGSHFKPDAPFELAGADGVFRPAKIVNYLPRKSMCEGTITNNVIELSAADVTDPKRVRYAWTCPWTGCVYSDVDLPLGTFLMDVERDLDVGAGLIDR